MGTEVEKEYALPSSFSKRYVRAIVGFAIAIPIGLAPFLGKVAGVDALLNLFPQSSRGGMIIFSTFLMGTIAAVIQFGESLARTDLDLRRPFAVTVGILAVSFALLFIFYSLFIEAVPIEHGTDTIAVIIGPSRIQSPPCQCQPVIPTIQCIKQLGIGNEAAIETCWDSEAIRKRRVLLHSSYLLVMGSFGALIGVGLLQEKARNRRRRRSRKAATPASTEPSPPHGTS